MNIITSIKPDKQEIPKLIRDRLFIFEINDKGNIIKGNNNKKKRDILNRLALNLFSLKSGITNLSIALSNSIEFRAHIA
ncbi:MAG TPA: hypothetical protein VJ583_10915 [Nitrososphaeraceae archaeon]|nr:hypothetical protein [Nitrososphaeraceae archaeon]